VVIAVSLLAAVGAGISSRIEEQRLTQTFMTPKAWPTTAMNLPTPVTAALTTHLGGAFLHYKLTVKPGSADLNEIEKQVGASNFTIRLLDKDGFTILLVRPGEDLALDRHAEGGPVFHLEDVVGCSAQIYASAESWSISWEGK
jgi:hypothetical protein